MPVSYCVSARKIFMLRLASFKLKDFLVCSKFYIKPGLLSPLSLDCTPAFFLNSLFKMQFPTSFVKWKSLSASSIYTTTQFLSCVLSCFSRSQTISLSLFLNRKLKKEFMTEPLMQNEQKFPICSLFMIQFSGFGHWQCWVDSWTSNLKWFLPTSVILWFYYIDSGTIQVLKLLDLGPCRKMYSLFSEKEKCANEARAVLVPK